MKKIAKLIMPVFLVLAVMLVLPTAFKAQAVYTSEYLDYEIVNEKAIITDCDTSISGSFTIPSKLGGYPVTDIGFYAFEECSNLTSVIISDGIVSIGKYAFRGCRGLKNITIPGSIKSVDNGAFETCTSLTDLIIPDSVINIDDTAFRYCTSLKSVKIGNSVTTVGDYAFFGCTSLTGITIPESVTSIGNYAFSGCTSLMNIAIKGGATAIGRDVFENTAYYNNSSNWKNKVLYIGNYLIKAKADIAGAYSISQGTSHIAGLAFDHCVGLTDITIPSSVISTGWSAFSGCVGLTRVIIQDGVTDIDDYTFYGCSALTSVTLPNTVKRIGKWAFIKCGKLSQIAIPDDVTSIGYRAFENTAYYENTSNWHNGVLYIGNHLIASSSDLSGQYSVRQNTKCIADCAFMNCSNLIGIVFPDSLAYIGSQAFESCTGLAGTVTLSGIKGIGDRAFKGCSNLSAIEVLSDDCSIGNDDTVFPSSAKIIGFSGSTAEAYAKKYNRNFELHKHTISSWTVNRGATCTESGSKQGTCSVCKNTETQSIPALGHNYSSSWTIDKAATCSENGSKSQHCTRCGDKKNVTLIATTGHKFSSWKTIKKATCTKDGSKQRTCSVCKKTETQSIAALGHNYEFAKVKAKATLSKNGSAVTKCKTCGLTSGKTVIYKIKTVKLSASSFVYNGKAKTPTVTVKDSKGKTLKKNTDYTVKYSSGRKNIGTYTVTVTFKGNYSGKKNLKFKIVLGQVSGVAQMNKKGINFAWNKVAGASGYEVYSYDVPTKRYVKLASTKKTQLGNSTAKGKMTIKIRAFKKVGNKTYYGGFSKPITFKAK